MTVSLRSSRALRSFVVLAVLTAFVAALASLSAPSGPVAIDAASRRLPRPLTGAQLAHRLPGDVYGYLPYWEIDAGTDAYLRYRLLTDIALFSIGMGADGAIDASARGYPIVTGPLAEVIVEHAHAAGVRVDMTVTSFGLDKNTAFFSDPTVMANAVASIVALVEAEGLDGVNVDVENLQNESFDEYAAFVGRLRSALRAANPFAQVSVATNGGLSGAEMARQAIANGADRAFIMGYDYRTAGTSLAGSVAPMSRDDGGKSLSWTLDQYAALGVPADRLVLGLPYYGRSWATTSGALHAPTTGSAGVFFPGRELATIPPGVEIQYDPVEQSAWFAVQDAATGDWTQTYFDDPSTLSAKYALAAARGLAGVGIWTLGYDRGAVGYWNVIPGRGVKRGGLGDAGL
jgi:hypothetical protein